MAGSSLSSQRLEGSASLHRSRPVTLTLKTLPFSNGGSKKGKHLPTHRQLLLTSLNTAQTRRYTWQTQGGQPAHSPQQSWTEPLSTKLQQRARPDRTPALCKSASQTEFPEIQERQGWRCLSQLTPSCLFSVDHLNHRKDIRSRRTVLPPSLQLASFAYLLP